jgi:hypothetical protein
LEDAKKNRVESDWNEALQSKRRTGRAVSYAGKSIPMPDV